MTIFNFLMSYIIFPLFFSSIIYIFTTIEKHSYTKGLILILGLFIFINYYFYKKIVMIIRKTYVNRINYYLSIILIFLTFFNTENFKEIIKIINQNIKNNFNQKIFLEIKNFLNTTSYFYSFSIIFIMGIIFLSTIIYNKQNNNKVEENNEEIKLLSFRKKEKEKLKSIIENKKISSILIEAEIGNGKTTLINSLFKDLQTQEIIYLKLPLIKSVDELKRNLFLELQKIFLKNDLDNQFLNAFLDNISAFKLGFLEINFGKKENMWNTIQKLQKTLKELNKNIIIVLDDIERENDTIKLYESILFLGELSEHFKDTKTTTLLLAQYSYLEDKLIEMNKDTLYLEKYYKYKFKLNEPTASEFLNEDYKLLIEEAISTSSNLSINKNFKDDFINSIIENINFFFTANEIVFNKENSNYIKINIRALEKSIKKIIYLYAFYEKSYITYSIFLYCILMENFYIFLENYILEMSKERNTSVKNIKEYILRAFSNFSLIYYSENNAYNICRDEIETILNTYNTGEIIIENIDIQSNIIKEILSGNIEKSGTLSVNGYEEYIFNLINGNPKKLDIALKNNLINNKSELIKIVNRTKDILDLSECSFNLMKNILLKGEYSQSELPTIPEDVEEIINYEKKKNLRTEVFDKLDKSKETFIKKIKETKYFQNNLPEIENLLKKDIELEKYWYDQATRW
ncbi:P-loop NTPase fold protein [Fusobacterium polymorphum]|uniref:P-loop NTPase fold protein n=1 Tax=Fusobacterium nucleatum subsp. polymorphum TaxID=76857 RepID=UPI00300A8982